MRVCVRACVRVGVWVGVCACVRACVRVVGVRTDTNIIVAADFTY